MADPIKACPEAMGWERAMMPLLTGRRPQTICELRVQQLEQAALEELIRGHITAAERLWDEAHTLRQRLGGAP